MSQERVLLGQYTGKSKSGGNYRHIRVDGSTETIQVIDYEHHEIHGGSHYFLSGVNDLSINEVYDVQFTASTTQTFEVSLWSKPFGDYTWIKEASYCWQYDGVPKVVKKFDEKTDIYLTIDGATTSIPKVHAGFKVYIRPE